MTSSWYITRPVAGSGPVVAWRGPSAAPTPVESTPATPAARPPRAAFRTRRAHAAHPARPPRRAHRQTTEAYT